MNELQALYHELLKPSNNLVADLASLEGNIIVLGAGGKMGPALCELAKAAIDLGSPGKKITAISRFREPGVQELLHQKGIETINADLLNDTDLFRLPNAENIIYMAGMKFGSAGNAPLTWAMNTYLPARVAEKYKHSRIVAFSTGNVYPMMPVFSGGASEQQETGPIGEYAQSCLGRERMFQYFSALNNTPVLIYRLNYANDVTYGVLHEIAQSVKNGKTIDLSMGHFNAIWQGDANEMALRALKFATAPASVLNITGPETVSVRWCATEFGRLFGIEPKFSNEEQSTALLNNAAESFRLFGYPRVSLTQMMHLLVNWINAGGKKLDKPTHFQERKGIF